MLSSVQLEKVITDMQLQESSNDELTKRIKNARIDSLIWALNSGTIKSVAEIQHRIARYQEELLVFADHSNPAYKEKIARIDELENLIQSLL